MSECLLWHARSTQLRGADSWSSWRNILYPGGIDDAGVFASFAQAFALCAFSFKGSLLLHCVLRCLRHSSQSLTVAHKERTHERHDVMKVLHPCFYFSLVLDALVLYIYYESAARIGCDAMRPRHYSLVRANHIFCAYSGSGTFRHTSRGHLV